MGARPVEVIRVEDPGSGLDAVIVIDSETLGPAAGGVRTSAYADVAAATADASQLAEAMTIKCALAGLAAGGGKAAVRADRLIDRPAAFAALGEAIEGLAGRFRTAGDLGTTADDLAAMASRCQYVHTQVADLSRAVARGHLACVRAAFGADLAGATAAVQGVGAIGRAVTEALIGAGLAVTIADVDEARVRHVAGDLGATVADPTDILAAEVDVLAPCARGGVIDASRATSVRARVLCGGANNILASRDAERALVNRGVIVVPDVISSAGAVIDGIGETVMGLADRGPLIDALAETTREVLAGGGLPSERAVALARARLTEPPPE